MATYEVKTPSPFTACTCRVSAAMQSSGCRTVKRRAEGETLSLVPHPPRIRFGLKVLTAIPRRAGLTRGGPIPPPLHSSTEAVGTLPPKPDSYGGGCFISTLWPRSSEAARKQSKPAAPPTKVCTDEYSDTPHRTAIGP